MKQDPVYFLLVDDLEENLLSLEALLKRDGLVLLKARSGEEALELLLGHDVALALLDVQMPEMNGFELAELMRGVERTKRVPIIFLTAGSADRQRRFRGYEAGAVDFLQKPIEAEILQSKAGIFFDLHRQKQQIAAQRDELRAYAEALQEADRRKDEFLATLAHELRNPLAPIRNGLQLLRSAPAHVDREELRQMMDRQLSHLVHLIDDLMDVSRVSQGKIILRKERVEIADILRSAVELGRPLVEAGGHRLVVRESDVPLAVEADPTRLAQVIGNLLNNAAKYTPDGGCIELAARRDGAEVLIAVSDDGVGIEAAMLPKVFDLFTQVDHSLDRAKGGLGIGLALVKRLMDLHGGSVSVESAGLGRGSTFTLRLPLAEPAPVAEAPPAETQEATTAPLRVLVVDDNIDVAQTVGWMLESFGHDYELVHDGAAALDAARRFEPDAMLLDIGLPGMDGYAVCEAFRADPRFRELPIIAQTGWGQDLHRAKAGAAGFDAHLVKPVNLETLERTLSGAIDARRQAGAH